MPCPAFHRLLHPLRSCPSLRYFQKSHPSLRFLFHLPAFLCNLFSSHPALLLFPLFWSLRPHHSRLAAYSATPVTPLRSTQPLHFVCACVSLPFLPVHSTVLHTGRRPPPPLRLSVSLPSDAG